MKSYSLAKDNSKERTGAGPLCVACAVNDQYGMQLAVTLYTLIAHAGPKNRFRIFILGRGIRKQTREKIESIVFKFDRVVSLEWLNADTINLAHLPAARSSHLPPEIYLRLFLPLAVPCSVKKLLYIDTDVLVEADVSKLFAIPMLGNTILAVRDFGFHDMSRGLPLAIHHLPCPPDAPYFNSGVMMVDLESWKKWDCFNRSISYIESFKQTIQWGDQDVLNAVLSPDWGLLDERWNVQVSACLNHAKWEDSSFKTTIGTRLKTLFDPPCILHFVGPWKPWQAGLDNRLQKRYFRYLAASGWFNPVQFYFWYLIWLLKGIGFWVQRRFFVR